MSLITSKIAKLAQFSAADPSYTTHLHGTSMPPEMEAIDVQLEKLQQEAARIVQKQWQLLPACNQLVPLHKLSPKSSTIIAAKPTTSLFLRRLLSTLLGRYGPQFSAAVGLHIGDVTTFNDCPNLESIFVGTDYRESRHTVVPVLESMSTMKVPAVDELVLEVDLARTGNAYRDMLIACNPRDAS
ncbi:hypothetical protein BT96DRAFT_999207 [Gymnopus androsaceus JB14]|uniref:Uncharacterized protein n=1 Tax=Gymnopus androsaceus JB14 TaxID=1447944 RepID=A0A6A4H654_9AGAR|nr:hypothetical protein BT96DRAFT_999207 [Gymnopus androsaceus JB14]